MSESTSDQARPETPKPYNWREHAPADIDLAKVEGVVEIKLYYGAVGVQTSATDLSLPDTAPIDPRNPAHLVAWAVHSHFIQVVALASELLMRETLARTAPPSGGEGATQAN